MWTQHRPLALRAQPPIAAVIPTRATPAAPRPLVQTSSRATFLLPRAVCEEPGHRVLHIPVGLRERLRRNGAASGQQQWRSGDATTERKPPRRAAEAPHSTPVVRRECTPLHSAHCARRDSPARLSALALVESHGHEGRQVRVVVGDVLQGVPPEAPRSGRPLARLPHGPRHPGAGRMGQNSHTRAARFDSV